MTQTMAQTGLTADQVIGTWVSTKDNRTRETHRGMDGQSRPFGVPFDSPSGAKLLYPGDPSAPAEEVVNCRCHRVFRIQRMDLAA
jgi:uncharacterized protein with gpF-like domain